MRTLDLGEAVGPGVPTGGTANQVLVKNGATNFDTSWKDASQLPAIGDEETAREAADAALADGLAIIANGDTHAAVAAGQAVFVRSHSTLAPGLYWASSAIGTNAALSTSNLTADSQGGLNKLNGDIDSLNSNLNTVVNNSLTSANSNVLINMQRMVITGKVVTYNLVLEVSAQLARNVDILTGLQEHNGGFNGVPTIVSTNNEGGFTHFSVADGGKLISAETVKTGRWRMAFSYVI